jgi:hypothetical protein
MAESASARENVVTLSQHSVPLTAAQRKVVADLLPELADRLDLAKNNSRTISFTINELQAIRQKAQEAIRHAETGMIRNSLRHIIEATSKAIEESQGIGSIPSSERLYQFKITLVESKPPIWRRIQVKNSTLDKFHERIQTAMGWTNSHLHRFEIKGERYGDPENLDDGYDDFHCVDSKTTKISDIVPKDGKRIHFLYLYDFGDNWRHEVIFEGCLRAESGQRYPLCLEGQRACPPEDVGGIWGYADFLEALADPSHEEHEEFKQWAGNFDPEEFDTEKMTKMMKRGLPDWRQSDG